MALPYLDPPILRALFDCETEEDWASQRVWMDDLGAEIRRGGALPGVDAAQGRDPGGLDCRPPRHRPAIWWRLDAPEERPEGESQASFLRRHRLFLRGEERRLPADAFRARAS